MPSAGLPCDWGVKRSADSAAAVATDSPWRSGVKRMRREEEDEDVFSSLPDAIIGHIFSFLSIKDILKTSAVSKRWCRLWTNTTSIYYSCHWSRSPSGRGFKGLCSAMDRALFQCSFLTRLHVGHFFYKADCKPLFDSWLRYAVTHRLLDFTLMVEHSKFYGGYHLPVFFFTYPSLVSLHLRGCFFTPCHGCVSWDSLQVLRLEDVEMTDALLGLVLNGSPSLESLQLVGCWGMNHIRLDSKKLRLLVINGYGRGVICAEDLHPHDDVHTLGVSAPHLLSLQILGKQWYGKRVVCLHHVYSLVQVKLDFRLRKIDHTTECLTILLRALSSVNSLMLGMEIIEHLAMNIEKVAPPHGLRCHTLILGDSVQGSHLMLLKFLLRCTRVQNLVIYFDGIKFRKKTDINGGYEYIFMPPLSGCKGWVNHLKTIEMKGFQATPPEKTKCELIVIGFLLREAVVMEKMVINIQGDCTKEVQRQVLGLPRASKASKVIFNYLH